MKNLEGFLNSRFLPCPAITDSVGLGRDHFWKVPSWGCCWFGDGTVKQGRLYSLNGCLRWILKIRLKVQQEGFYRLAFSLQKGTEWKKKTRNSDISKEMTYELRAIYEVESTIIIHVILAHVNVHVYIYQHIHVILWTITNPTTWFFSFFKNAFRMLGDTVTRFKE